MHSEICDFENSLRSDTQNPYDFIHAFRQEINQNSLNQACFIPLGFISAIYSVNSYSNFKQLVTKAVNTSYAKTIIGNETEVWWGRDVISLNDWK